MVIPIKTIAEALCCAFVNDERFGLAFALDYMTAIGKSIASVPPLLTAEMQQAQAQVAG